MWPNERCSATKQSEGEGEREYGFQVFNESRVLIEACAIFVAYDKRE